MATSPGVPSSKFIGVVFCGPRNLKLPLPPLPPPTARRRSPTFVISKIYKGKPNLIHVDAYRLQGQANAIFDDLDLESFLTKCLGPEASAVKYGKLISVSGEEESSILDQLEDEVKNDAT